MVAGLVVGLIGLILRSAGLSTTPSPSSLVMRGSAAVGLVLEVMGLGGRAGG